MAVIDVYVGQIMTDDPIKVDESQPLSEAATTMMEAGIKSVVVTDGAAHPTGILTSTDFLRMAADDDTSASVTVGDYMTREIVTTSPETEVRDAADQMMTHGISHLPVVDPEDRLTAIVTTTDVARYVSGFEIDD